MHQDLTSIVFIVILIVWGAEHIAVSALHAAARIRDTYQYLFPSKKPPMVGLRIVDNRDQGGSATNLTSVKEDAEDRKTSVC